jgi:hypothetical protein
MMPRSSTTFTPREGTKYNSAIKISLHREERDEIVSRAWKREQTPSEWARDVIRKELESER